VKTHTTNAKPDKAGSRAANTAQFPAMLIAWRTRNQLSRAAAARMLWCSAGTIGRWERGQSLPQGARNPRLWAAMVAMLKGGAL
jgi:DNA-binding transcriptional regulator YiaG